MAIRTHPSTGRLMNVITRLEKVTMINTMNKEPKFTELFMTYLLSRNGRIEEDLIDQLFNSSENAS